MRRSIAFLFSTAICTAASAQIVHDGSLGKAGPVGGQPALILPNDGDARGRVVGQNVFYSFSRFDLAKGQTARFLNPGQNLPIRNILARVTSGARSSIDGTIEVVDPQTNLFMMNPAGFIFGPSARLDVQGSVLFTSADYIKLRDGAQFDANVTVSPVLTSAPPSAFGFLGVQRPGAIRISGATVDQTTLSVPDGAVMSMIGGDVEISATRLVATGGRINLVSVAGAGEVAFDAADPNARPAVTAASSQGAIALRDNSTVRTALGGGISIRGGSLLLENSSMVADTDVVPGGSVDIDVTGRYESVRSQIDVSTEGASPAGSVNIRADEVILRGQSIAGGLTTAISAETTGAGDGGDVTIDARTIDVSDHANIAASANDAGNGGNVLLRATERVTLDGSTGPQPLTGIISETVGVPSDPTAAGKAGDIIITAPRVEMLRNAQITARTKSFGAAGNVVINCDTLLIDGTGTGSTSFTGIEARVGDDFGSDPGGEGLGAPGPGGVVEINATDSVVLRKGGVITASTFGLGDGGGMQINAARLFLRGSTQHEFTGLFARTTHANQGGRGGDIRLDVGAIEITNRATISASSDLAAGDAGGIVINVSGPLVLRHGGAINVSSDLVNGGNIEINSSGMISLNDRARVAASAQENGGNIRIIARTIALSDSTITGQAGRSGGVITIDAGAVSLGDRSTINGIANLEDVRVDINGALLQAIDSSILSDNTNFVVDTDLASSLVRFDIDVRSASARLQNFCGIRAERTSSFGLVGRGGLTLDPARAAPAR